MYMYAHDMMKVIHYSQLYPINSSLRPFSCTPESVVSLPWRGKTKKWLTSTVYIFMIIIIYNMCTTHGHRFSFIWWNLNNSVSVYSTNAMDNNISYHNCWTPLRGNVFLNAQLNMKTCVAQTGYQLMLMHTCMPGSPGYTTANGIKPLQCPS